MFAQFGPIAIVLVSFILAFALKDKLFNMD